MLGSFGSSIFGQSKYVHTFVPIWAFLANLQHSYVIQALLTKHSTPFKVPMIQQ